MLAPGVQAKHEAAAARRLAGRTPGGRSTAAALADERQPRATDAHEPIFEVRRHPIGAVASIANGFTTSGACRNPSRAPLGRARVALRRHLRAAAARRRAPRRGAAPRRGDDVHARAARAAAARAALLGEVEPARRPLGGAAPSPSRPSASPTLRRAGAPCDARRSYACPPHVRSALAADATAAAAGRRRRRRRRRPGARAPRPRPPEATLTWEALREVDAEMAAVAWELARGTATARSRET